MNLDFPRAAPAFAAAEVELWERSDRLREEEFTRAVTLGLYDYARKSRSRGFVVSLSGGADSAAVASLAAMTVRRGIEEVGLDVVCHALGKTPERSTPSAPSAASICRTAHDRLSRNPPQLVDDARCGARRRRRPRGHACRVGRG